MPGYCKMKFDDTLFLRLIVTKSVMFNQSLQEVSSTGL